MDVSEHIPEMLRDKIEKLLVMIHINPMRNKPTGASLEVLLNGLFSFLLKLIHLYSVTYYPPPAVGGAASFSSTFPLSS